MAEPSSDLEGPDFEKGFDIDDVPDGTMLLGHAFNEAVLVSRRGDELFAIGATCTHYGGPFAKGLMVDCTVRCHGTMRVSICTRGRRWLRRGMTSHVTRSINVGSSF